MNQRDWSKSPTKIYAETDFGSDANRYIAYLKEHLEQQIESNRKLKCEVRELRKKMKHLNLQVKDLSMKTVRLKIEKFEFPIGIRT